MASGRIDTSQEPQANLQGLNALAGEENEVLVLVQFEGPIQESWLTACEQSGATVHHYLPECAYLMSVAPKSVGALSAAEGVSWIGPLAPALRIHPRLSEAALTGAGSLAVTILSVDDLPAKALRDIGYEVTSTRMTQMGWQDTRATIPASALSEVASLWSVFHIELQPEYEMHGERGAQTAAGNYPPAGTIPSGPGYVAWLQSNGLNGAPGLIAQVQDDGLDQGDASNTPATAHPDILGRIAGIFNATSDPLGNSTAGHGQINAGIIMGNATVGTTDGGGFLLGQGVAPSGEVYATKIFRNSGAFDIGANSFTDLAQDAQDAGAILSSNSWGASVFGDYTADAAEFDALTRDADPSEAGNQPMIYFFSAGNSGPGSTSLGSPGTAKNVIAVGAGENTDADGVDGCGIGPTGADSLRDLISFSSRGPTTDGRLGVTVFSVGTHVQGPASTDPGFDGTGVCDQFWPGAQTDYARSSGTSHSCPTAAGAGLIVYELFNTQLSLLGHTANPSPALMRAVLANTATDMVGGDDGSGGSLANVPDPDQGWGSVNLSTLVDNKNDLFSFDQAQIFTGSGQSWDQLIVPIDPGKPLRITLAWTDAPGVPLASPVLVNDLDLSVTDGGTTYLGNVFSGGFSTTGGSFDRLNTLESVYVQNPSGVYTITVDAFNIAADGVPNVGGALDQDFALFVWNGTDQTQAGIINIDKGEVNCADTIQVIVSDADLQGVGTTAVPVSSSSGDIELLTLTETASGTGVLIGAITTTTGPPASDGVLQVADGDVIKATYNDADDGTASPAVVSDTATVDCSPPVIFNVNVINVTTDQFTVTFETNEPATGAVFADLVCGGSTFTGISGEGVSHEITLDGLTECTPYLFRIEATDGADNTAVDDNSTNCYSAITFTFSAGGFTDDFEPLAEPGWTHSASLGSDNWLERSSANAESPTNVYSYEPGTSGISDARLVTPAVQGGAELSFWHTFSIETSFDGAVIEISDNGGSTWTDLGPFITQGGYNGTISGSFGSPIGGQPAWTGGSFGAMSEVVADLSSFPGTVNIGFRFVSDSSVTSVGWQIDDVTIASIEPCVSDEGVVVILADVYPCSDTLDLQVRDLNAGPGPLSILVTTGGGDMETVDVTDPDMDSIYTGTLTIGAAGETLATGDNRIQGSPLDVITATYSDADDGTGPAVVDDTAVLDCQPPVVLNVGVTGLETDEFTVTFNTDEPATVVVNADLTCGGSSFTGAGPLGTSHSITLIGLSSCTTHRFEIEATDAVGNFALDDNGGLCHQTTTRQFQGLTDTFDPSADPSWTHSAAQGSDNWAVRSSANAHSPTNVYSYEPGTSGVSDARLVLPGVAGGGELRFWHTFSMETSFDGAVLEISTNGGSTWSDLGAFITQGGYTGTISASFSSPIGGQPAWTGGSLGSMTEVVVDLTTFPGTVDIGYRFASDSSVTSIGWQIDDVVIGVESPCPVDAGAVEIVGDLQGCGTTMTVIVSDLNAPAGPLSVTVTTGAGDFETVTVTDPDVDKVYSGTIPIDSPGTPVSVSDGTLQGALIDLVEARYSDADDGTGNPALSTDSALLDCLATAVDNFSFETGSFPAWIVQDLSSPFFTLQVAGAGGNSWPGFFVSAPPDGIFAALHGFDGDGPGTIRIGQDVTLPSASDLSMDFDYRGAWDLTFGATQDRRFEVNIEPAGGGTPLQTDVILTAVAGTVNNDTGNVTENVDLTPYAGTTVRISFDWWVPETFTGPGFFQLDNVRLTAPVGPVGPVIIAQSLGSWTYVPAIVADGVLGSTFDGDEQATGSVQSDDDADGSGSDLSLNIGSAAGDSYHFFQSPLSAIPFFDGATYRTTWSVSSTNADPAAGPQLRTRFAYGAFGNMGNGNQVVSGVVSLPGAGTDYRRLFDQLDVASANASIPVGTDTTAENDMLLFFEMIDIGNPSAAGDLEVDNLLVERLNRTTLRAAEAVETTVTNFTTTNTIGGIQFGNTPITVSTTTGNATITAPVNNGGAGVTVFGNTPLNLLEDGIAINPFTPANTNGFVYRAQVTLNASSNSTVTPLPLATLRLQTFSSALQSTLYTIETQLNSLRFGGTALNPNYGGAGEILSGYLQLPPGVALDGTDPDGGGPGLGFGDQLVSSIQLQDGEDNLGGSITITDFTINRFPESILP